MKGKYFKLPIFIICIIIVQTMNKTVYEMPSNNKGTWEIAAKKGDTISIKIRGNKTTGYSWYLANREQLSQNIIKPLNLDQHGSTTNYMMDENPEHLMGVGGYFYFDFQIPENIENQVVDLEFLHKRPWEPEAHSKTIVKLSIGEKTEL
jgi:predicted secreted protein